MNTIEDNLVEAVKIILCRDNFAEEECKAFAHLISEHATVGAEVIKKINANHLASFNESRIAQILVIGEQCLHLEKHWLLSKGRMGFRGRLIFIIHKFCKGISIQKGKQITALDLEKQQIMVNEIIKHLNSIGEVNLSAKKIELGLIDDIQDLSNQVSKITQAFDEQISIFEKAKAELKNIIKEL